MAECIPMFYYTFLAVSLVKIGYQIPQSIPKRAIGRCNLPWPHQLNDAGCHLLPDPNRPPPISGANSSLTRSDWHTYHHSHLCLTSAYWLMISARVLAVPFLVSSTTTRSTSFTYLHIIYIFLLLLSYNIIMETKFHIAERSSNINEVQSS